MFIIVIGVIGIIIGINLLELLMSGLKLINMSGARSGLGNNRDSDEFIRIKEDIEIRYGFRYDFISV